MATRRLEIVKLRSERDVNSYIIACKGTGEAVVVDPGQPADAVIQQAEGLRLRYLLITHGHPGHSSAKLDLQQATGALAVMHMRDATLFLKSADIYAEGRERLEFGQFEVRVVATPGHTPGSLCYLIGNHLFSGDTLFQGGVGKEMPESDLKRLFQSLVLAIRPLPDSTVIYPGHGPTTNLAAERRVNPYLR